ncbi:Peroxiredoxin-2 [Nucella lapillus]
MASPNPLSKLKDYEHRLERLQQRLDQQLSQQQQQPSQSAVGFNKTSPQQQQQQQGIVSAAACGGDCGCEGTMAQMALQKPAPEFSLQAVVSGEFKTVKLSQYRGKYVVLFFYPLDFTFVCPTEIIAFSDRAEEFRSINCEVLAASTDSVFSHLAWVNTPRKQGGLGNMKIPLLADKNLELARMYGCLKEDEGIAFRALYIIDDKGNLRQITMNDLPVGRSVDETIRLVQAFQFTDKHGEVCPVGWKPGEDTIKPNVKDSKSYFKANN